MHSKRNDTNLPHKISLCISKRVFESFFNTVIKEGNLFLSFYSGVSAYKIIVTVVSLATVWISLLLRARPFIQKQSTCITPMTE